MIERIGYIMASEAFFDSQEPEAEITGLGFQPCTQIAVGQYEDWSPKTVAEAERLGFHKVMAVVSDVTRESTKIHHNGLQAHFMKTCSDKLEAQIRRVPESVVTGIINRFYDDLVKLAK